MKVEGLRGDGTIGDNGGLSALVAGALVAITLLVLLDADHGGIVSRREAVRDDPASMTRVYEIAKSDSIGRRAAPLADREPIGEVPYTSRHREEFFSHSLRNLGARLAETTGALRHADETRQRMSEDEAMLEASVERLLDQRDRARAGNAWHSERLEYLSDLLDRSREDARLWRDAVETRIVSRRGRLEEIAEKLGIDAWSDLLSGSQANGLLETSVAETATGGPLEELPEAGQGLPIAMLSEPGVGKLARDRLTLLEALDRSLASLPIGSPMYFAYPTSGYGQRKDPISGRRAYHRGLDLAAARGTRVRATGEGTVVHAGRSGAYGILVEVDHGRGLTSRFAHLARALVAVGDRVTVGMPLGIIGNTGRSTGRHLHYEIALDGTPRDPMPFLVIGRDLARDPAS